MDLDGYVVECDGWKEVIGSEDREVARKQSCNVAQPLCCQQGTTKGF